MGKASPLSHGSVLHFAVQRSRHSPSVRLSASSALVDTRILTRPVLQMGGNAAARWWTLGSSEK